MERKSRNIINFIGTRKSAEIFKHLNEDEIEELTQIANMRMVSSEEKNRL